MRKIDLTKILSYILSLTILADYANGFFIGKHIGECVRTLLIIICLLIIIKYRKRKYIIMTIILFIYIFLNVSISYTENKASLRTNISTGLKLLLYQLIICAILSAKEKFSTQRIENIFLNNLLYTPLLFYISLFIGSGKSSYNWYGIELGNKSYFISLNSINIVLCSFYIYIIYKLLYSNHRTLWAFMLMYVMVPMILLGTKTSVIVIFSIPVFYILFYIKNKKQALLFFISLVVLIVGFSFLSKYIGSAISAIIERQLYLLKSRDLITYFFSTRNERLSYSLNEFINSLDVIDLVPGRGYYSFHSEIAKYYGFEIMPIEMDWIDILSSYGIFGLILDYSMCLNIMIKRINTRKDLKCISPFLLSSIIMFAFGNLAGHVFLEAMPSTIFAIVLLCLVQ